MNKKKLGRTLFTIPFILLGISVLFRILYDIGDLLSDFSIYLFILFFCVSPLLLGLGLYFMIKYKDKGEPLNTIKNIYPNIKNWIKRHNKFFSKKVSFKNVILGFFIALISLIVLIFVIYKIKDYILTEKYSRIVVKEKIEVEDIATDVRIDEIKRRLYSLIPDKYVVAEAEENSPGIYDDGCISLYSLYPKDYSKLEKKYFDPAFITYCKDINTATIEGQVGGIRYDKEKDSWFFYYYDDERDAPQRSEEMRVYGNNFITISEVWGSHHSRYVYIVRIDNSNEIIIFEIPQSTRIRCDEYDDNGVVTWDEECINFLNSLKISDVGNAWVFNEVYSKDYEDLLKILKSI